LNTKYYFAIFILYLSPDFFIPGNNESDPGCDQKQKRVTDGEADYVQIKASNAEVLCVYFIL